MSVSPGPLLICFVPWQFKTTAPSWQRPPFDNPLREKKKTACKGCGCAAWHKQGRQAEKSVMRCLSISLNIESPAKLFFQVQLLVEIIGTPSAAKAPTHPSPMLYSWITGNNWLQANNLSLQLAYHWAEVKAMAFCWITFPLINDTLSEKISPGEWQGGLGIHHDGG